MIIQYLQWQQILTVPFPRPLNGLALNANARKHHDQENNTLHQNLPGALTSRMPPPSPLLALPGALFVVFKLRLLALSLRARICARAASLLMGVPGTLLG